MESIAWYASSEYWPYELADLNEKRLLDGECGYMPEYGESQRVAKKTSTFYSGIYKPGVEAEESTRAGYDYVRATVEIDPYITINGVIATM